MGLDPNASNLVPKAVLPDDDKYVSLAMELGPKIAKNAEAHDRDNTFVADSYELLKEAGYLRLPIPTELGGQGASLRQVCYAQAELAKYCGSTALAANMHLYVACDLVYQYRHGNTKLEGLLRRVGTENAVLMTSGGSDWIWPAAIATRVDGGYKVTGRKVFCSQAPVADVLTTTAAYDDPQAGRIVLVIGVGMKSTGVKIIETWDTMGMRGTASHDVQLDDVFVSDAQVNGQRPYGRLDPLVREGVIFISPPAAAVYYGIAAGARDEAVRTILARKGPDGTPMSNDPSVQRLVGLMDSKLRNAWWSITGALSELGTDFVPSEWAFNTVLLARRNVLEAGVAVTDLALEAVGGSSYFKRMKLERAYRDVRAGKYHPLTPEKALYYAGRLSLGLPNDVA
jgi:alkylation response protein AidB-like acyl-CoA dehydrogenase